MTTMRDTTVSRAWSVILALGLGAMITFAGGCDSSGKTGGLVGGGIGALAGQAIGGSTKSTLIGAGVGAGLGYIIGNEKDKKEAKQQQSQATRTTTYTSYTHTQVGPLANTRWQLLSVAPPDRVAPFASKIIEFRPYGRVITTTTNPDGSIEVADESYRVVGSTLIVNRPGFIINAAYRIQGDEMTVDAADFRAILRRIR